MPMCWVAVLAISVLLAACNSVPAKHQSTESYDVTLAQSLGADEYGMRRYVLVVLKTGPTPVPKGDERTRMFKGHMANMQRLADEGKLVMAGPLDGVDGWRGIFVFATPDIEAARKYVATDPTIIQGEFVAEFHKLYSSAALMKINEISHRISKESP